MRSRPAADSAVEKPPGFLREKYHLSVAEAKKVLYNIGKEKPGLPETFFLSRTSVIIWYGIYAKEETI